MTLAFSLAVAVVFGAGTFLVLQRDLMRVVVGIVLISNSASLFIVAAGLTRGPVPILPVPGGDGASVSDPLVQAMALTAIIITSSVTALLLSVVYRLYVSHDSVDLTDISEAEVREAEFLERDTYPEEEEEPYEEPGQEEIEERSR
ncbi:MAG: Na(+) H(+) antiporter subunit C [uncultured Rubrobacteraceae bacterium]|uniref:Na(+) H(+) antiporter subunit C n=1 Tax=uncultured Rubrobacteraceae bacterium TaxID=349277 RepID=A0A6J4Q3T3_9ACTN|nr:MAG: Na(+) H(+) antiporter subunit C [uncultured Rubrobacteraceae bacterium]